MSAKEEKSIDVKEKVDCAQYLDITLEEIIPNEKQPRKFFEKEALLSLAKSISTLGLLEDIMVRPKGNKYEIVLGERRWRASQLAKTGKIRAKVVNLTDEEMERIAIVENIQREDLSTTEEAFAYKKYLEKGFNEVEVGEYLGDIGEKVGKKLKVLSSQYYIKYQEEKINTLEKEIEELKNKEKFEYKVIAEEHLIEFLNKGFEFLHGLSNNRFLMGKKEKTKLWS